MPELNFSIDAAEPIRFAAVPTLAFRLTVEQASEGLPPARLPIENILLQAQIQIDAPRRRYRSQGAGRPARFVWRHRKLEPDVADYGIGRMRRSWCRPSTIRVVVDLAVPCTFDFNVAATKYFSALEDGDVPLTFLFSGTIFYRDEGGGLQATRIPWSKECQYRLPASVWRLMMDAYYPNTAWLCLERDVVEKLAAFKRAHGIPTFERALEELLSTPLTRTRTVTLPRESPPSAVSELGHEPRAGQKDCRRSSLRGLHSLSVPRVGDQEPSSVQFRDSDARGVGRAPAGRRKRAGCRRSA